MKSLFCYAIGFLFILITLSTQVHGLENESIINRSQGEIADKYAERYCSAKADNFFNGLDNEKTLKYSYFKYIGLQSKEMYSNYLYKTIIKQIKEKCIISKDEEREINEFFLKAQNK